METSQIQGWGADLDPKDRPAYPKERTPPRHVEPNMSPPVFQAESVEILHSNERPTLTPLFGTPVPPKGFSGFLRRIAFKFTENDIRHWLILLFADRINVAEGIVDDLSQGHVPNVFEEMGLKSEWKYNRKSVVKKAAIATAALGIGYYLLQSRRKKARKAAR